MSENFNKAFEDLLGNEGGYSNNPADPGGETMWGITFRVARGNGYSGAMRDMPKSVAADIYSKLYWLPAFDSLPYALAFQLFDAAVNSGVSSAVAWLQRSVGVSDDGKFGPATLKAVQAMDPLKVVMLFNAERLSFMASLPTWPNFGKGWARRIAGNLKKGAA